MKYQFVALTALFWSSLAYSQEFFPFTIDQDHLAGASDSASKRPSSALNGGTAPVWMERVARTVHLATSAKSLHVYPLSGTGSRRAALAGDDGEGQALSPWFELVCEGGN